MNKSKPTIRKMGKGIDYLRLTCYRWSLNNKKPSSKDIKTKESNYYEKSKNSGSPEKSISPEVYSSKYLYKSQPGNLRHDIVESRRSNGIRIKGQSGELRNYVKSPYKLLICFNKERNCQIRQNKIVWSI